MLEILRDDALTTTRRGFELRVSLPWIRSLPVASLSGLALRIDDDAVEGLHVALHDRTIPVAELADHDGWWFVQDRIVLTARRRVTPGSHAVRLSFALSIPYLEAGPDAPLRIPFDVERSLTTDATTTAPSVARDVA